MSASRSPALAPCGMLFLVELDELAPDDVDDVVAAGADELLDELDELDPQAATAMATSTSARGASRRTLVWVFVFMDAPSARLRGAPADPLDARGPDVVPRTVSRLRSGEPNPLADGKKTVPKASINTDRCLRNRPYIQEDPCAEYWLESRS